MVGQVACVVNSLPLSTHVTRITRYGKTTCNAPLSPEAVERICRAIAIAFTPQISSAYAFLALSYAAGMEKTLSYLLISIMFASLIELGSLLAYLRFLKRDVNVENREDRPILFVIGIFSYIIGFALLRYFRAPFIFSALMFAYVANTLLAAAITKYLTKVSIHTWGITGPSVAILYSFGFFGFALMLLLGAIVGSTRIRLRYHTRRQVALSFLTSIPLTWFIVNIVPLVLPIIFS